MPTQSALCQETLHFCFRSDLTLQLIESSIQRKANKIDLITLGGL